MLVGPGLEHRPHAQEHCGGEPPEEASFPLDHGAHARTGDDGRMISWLFRNRETGAITVAQFPNLPLWIFIGAAAVRAVLSPGGDVGTAIDVVALAALAWWAVDELLRGVNPWRRFLGGGVLAYVVCGLVTR